MITLDHRGEGGCQPNDHKIKHQGGLDSIYVFYWGHNNSFSRKFKVLKGQFNIKDKV
jgi:hypothetical protein